MIFRLLQAFSNAIFGKVQQQLTGSQPTERVELEQSLCDS